MMTILFNIKIYPYKEFIIILLNFLYRVNSPFPEYGDICMNFMMTNVILYATLIKMPVSQKLAHEIYYIELWHIVSLMLFIGVNLSIALKAKKTPLLYAYLAAELCVILWIVSKIFKTVSPDIGTRWFFIVTQYFGVSFLGGCLLAFSLMYAFKKKLKAKYLVLIFLPCLINFIIVATNPVHMLFYSKYTFYSDKFGPLFYAGMGMTYAYIIASTVFLSKGFIKMFGNERQKAVLFSAAIAIPVVINVFYVLDLFEKLFNYKPLFDYTPIAINASLLLFAVAAFRYRFFDVIPIAGRNVFDGMGDPAAVITDKNRIVAQNAKFTVLKGLLSDMGKFRDGDEMTAGGKIYKVKISSLSQRKRLVRLVDVTEINFLLEAAKAKNKELTAANIRLKTLVEKKNELAAIKMRTGLLQEMHDILGHSAVLALSYCEREAVKRYTSYETALEKIRELISSGNAEFFEVLKSDDIYKKSFSVISETEKLLQESGFMTSLTVQGETRELKTGAVSAVNAILREAVTNAIKYSRATTFDIVFRFDTKAFAVFVLDNGIGCGDLSFGAGLSGMKKKMENLKGEIDFSSFEGGGFRIYLRIPGEEAYAV